MADLIDYGVTNANQSYSFSNIDHFNVSSLVTRLTSDITNIQNAVATGMRPFGRSPVMLIFATSLAFRISSTLAMVFLVALPILATLPVWMSLWTDCRMAMIQRWVRKESMYQVDRNSESVSQERY